jgi:hypothetical protein
LQEFKPIFVTFFHFLIHLSGPISFFLIIFVL